MSSNPYAGYGGNPYAPDSQSLPTTYNQAQPSQNPHAPGDGYGQSNPYESQAQSPPPSQSLPPSGFAALSTTDFLSRVEAAKTSILSLSGQISTLASLHQKALSSPSSSSALSAQTSETQVLTTSIRDQIRFLETDAARPPTAALKPAQIGQLKSSFRRQLEAFRAEELEYEKRFRDQIARQYRVVHPDATDDEVREASRADWGDDGVFQTALKSNRTATAASVLGNVRQRHNDIRAIESTLLQLNRLFEDLAEAVVLQEPAVQAAEQRTEEVKRDTEQGNVQLSKGLDHAKRARKLKWWCLFIVVLILLAIALIVGLVVGLKNK